MWRPETDSPYLFVTQEGKPLTWNALRLMLVRVGKRAGVLRLHAHLLRHTFAVRFIEDGGDPFTLQRILGQTTLEMTRNYVNQATGQILSTHRRHSPIDRPGLTQMRVVKKKIA